MGQPATHLPTFDELYDQIRELPENLTGEILVPGVVRTMSRPGRRHRHASKLCLQSLGRFDADTGGSGWWLEVEAEIRFPGDRLFVPDLCGFRVERVPEPPLDNPITILPDWCCEILSPRTARDDVSLKLPHYARSGVPWIWMIDPSRQLVEVFETLAGRPALTATAKIDEVVALPPFDGEFAVGTWWLPDAGDE